MSNYGLSNSFFSFFVTSLLYPLRVFHIEIFKVSIRARADSHNSSPALLCGVHFGRKGNGRKRRTKQKRRLHGQTFVIQIPKQIATRWMSKSCIQPRRSKSDQKNLLPLSHNLYISFKILSEHTIDALYLKNIFL